MTDFDFQFRNDRLFVEGGVHDPEAAGFRDALTRAGQQHHRLDLLDLDLEDGVAVVETVNAVRALLAAHGQLILHHAPQMLAHTLYKVGMLEDGRLVLVEPRVEHPTVA